MNRFRRLLGPCLGALLMAFSAAQAQEKPRIGYVYPAGGRQGTTFQVTLGGQYLPGITRIHFTGKGIEASGIKVTPIRPDDSPIGKRLDTLESQKGQKDAATLKEIAELQREVSRYLRVHHRSRQQLPISETAVFQIILAADAGPGVREMRVETAAGFSTPLRF